MFIETQLKNLIHSFKQFIFASNKYITYSSLMVTEEAFVPTGGWIFIASLWFFCLLVYIADKELTYKNIVILGHFIIFQMLGILYLCSMTELVSVWLYFYLLVTVITYQRTIVNWYYWKHTISLLSSLFFHLTNYWYYFAVYSVQWHINMPTEGEQNLSPKYSSLE